MTCVAPHQTFGVEHEHVIKCFPSFFHHLCFELVSNAHLSSCYQNYWRAHWSLVFDISASKSKVFVSSVSSMRFWICRPAVYTICTHGGEGGLLSDGESYPVGHVFVLPVSVLGQSIKASAALRSLIAAVSNSLAFRRASAATLRRSCFLAPSFGPPQLTCL